MTAAILPNHRPRAQGAYTPRSAGPVSTAALRCIHCGATLGACGSGGVYCADCGRSFPLCDGLLIVQETFTGKNRIAADFYNSERWLRFRPWEQFFLKWQGGVPGARRQILRHLRHLQSGSLLEVGIGDGENVALLPPSLRIAGVDIAHRPLAACRDRFPERGLLLARAEGEHLPFAEGSFDAVLCVGGFNFFSDPEQALKEMARVARPGGRIVVADELPDLYRWGWGHLVGWPGFDAWLMRRFWFGPEFTAMVLGNRLDVHAVARQALGPYRVHTIWRGLGYCLVGTPK
jgi:SAM-dependent methyltransferase